MSRPRTVGPIMVAPTHSHPEGEPCMVATECAIHTVTLPEGSFSAIVQTHRPHNLGASIIAIIDHDEAEDHIRLLRNAVEDAKRIDAGLEPLDRTGSVEHEPNDPVSVAVREIEAAAALLDNITAPAGSEDDMGQAELALRRAIEALTGKAAI